MSSETTKSQLDADLRSVLSTPAGRRFVWRWLTQAGLQSSSFVSGDQSGTAFNEGRRSIALALLAEAQRVAPELYTTALREQLDAQEAAAQARKERAPES
ncbi:MAG: hypothetical protein Q8K32_09365 [Archangium sp.]|nr:hypothetical protein [Archangium sp.]